MSTESLHKYVRKMRRLNIDKARGPAPHKPILMLAVIELIEGGQVTENSIPVSPELAEIFLRYWPKVTRRKPDLAMPFFHLKSEGFWHLHPNSGYETALKVATQIKSVSRLREIVANASLEQDLFLLLTDARDRETIRQTIIHTYFPECKEQIESLITETQHIRAYRKSLLDHVELPFSTKKLDKTSQINSKIRSAGFRQAIMRLYDYTCAACELRILTMDGESATDAAHIVPFRISKNDDVRNGISFCKLHHWAFDKGLFSLGETHKIVVSDLMTDRGPTGQRLSELKDKPILLPDRAHLYPAQDAMAWHRKKILRH